MNLETFNCRVDAINENYDQRRRGIQERLRVSRAKVLQDALSHPVCEIDLAAYNHAGVIAEQELGHAGVIRYASVVELARGGVK